MPVVDRLLKLLSLLSISWEVILVGNHLDGADDSTPEVVRRIAARDCRIIPIVKPKKGMMGWDMRSGLEAARGRVLAVIDGDGQFPMEALITCYARLIEEELDMVKTYRVRRDDGPIRRLVSFSYNLVVRLLFPAFRLTDINSKPKVMTRDLLDRLQLEDDGWFIDAEIVLKASLIGARIGYEPINFYRLTGRVSFVRIDAIMEFIRKLLRFRKETESIRRKLSATARHTAHHKNPAATRRFFHGE